MTKVINFIIWVGGLITWCLVVELFVNYGCGVHTRIRRLRRAG
jgi:hypothetical protein